MITNVELVNAVGGGSVGIEFDLGELQTNLPLDSEYEPEQHPGLYFKLPQTEVTVMIFRTGEYHLSGGKSTAKLQKASGKITDILVNMSPKFESINLTFEVRNLVHTGDIGQELELSKLAVGLGLKNTEYNPEQFPGLVYSPEESEGTFLIFRSGKTVLTGCSKLNKVNSDFRFLNEKLENLSISDDSPAN